MLRNTALLWANLGILTKKRYDALCKEFGSIDATVDMLGEEFFLALKVREDGRTDALKRLAGFDPEREERLLQREGIQLFSLEDDAYPTALRQIADPPVFLYGKGDWRVLDQPKIGLVGTREISPYGQRVTEHFTRALVENGIVTVSGLAAGIDTAVAHSTLAAKGRTVAVLGHGLGCLSAGKRAFAQQILEAGGLVLSEFAHTFAGGTYTFPSRNRIIAGLSLATVVLEAPLGSGAIITADLALDYGREVFAVPGQVFDLNYEGCHKLIAQGHAMLAQSPSTVLQVAGIIQREAPASAAVYLPANADEQAVLDALTTMPQQLGAIAEKAKLSLGTLNATLTMLELNGAAKHVGGGQWVLA